MNSPVRIIFFLLLVFFLGAQPSQAVRYTPVMEWNGTNFNVMNGSGIYNLQPVDDPVVDVSFSVPNAVVVWQEPDNNHYLAYVVDCYHDRVQFFNADIMREMETESDITYNDPAGAGEFDSNELCTTNGGIVRGSELLSVNGTTYSRVNNLGGYVAADHVYTIVYEGAAGTGGKLTFPTGSLSSSDEFEIEYAYSSTAATNLLGDIDYSTAVAQVNGSVIGDPYEINQTTPTNEAAKSARPIFDVLVAIAQNLNTDAGNDIADVFVLDSGKVGTREPMLHTYQIEDDAAATFHYMDTYNGLLIEPQDVAVAQSGTNTLAVAAAAAWTAPGRTTPTVTYGVLNNGLITNHAYRLTVTAAPTGGGDLRNLVLEVSDETIGNTIGYYGPVGGGAPVTEIDIQHFVPGLNVHLLDGGAVDIIAGDYADISWTDEAVINDYIFICDSGSHRIKVVKGNDNGAVATSGSDSTFFGDDSTRRDYFDIIAADESIPNLMYVSAFRATESSFAVYTNNSGGGGPVTWTEVSNFASSGAADKHYMYDYETQVLLFGDGARGEIPALNDTIYAEYKPSLDVLIYGTEGSDEGQFDTPSGISARWNLAQGWYDIYVADTDNNRIVKLKFIPGIGGSVATVNWVTSWTTAYTGSDLVAPTDLVVMSDGQAAAADTVCLFVCDTGSDRVVVYRDTDAENEGDGGSTAPTFLTLIGENGTNLGQFTQPRGVSVVLNGNDFDVYVADSQRNYVTKFQKDEYPEIQIDYSNISEYAYLKTGSFLFEKNDAWSYLTRNAPDNAVIKFWYSDTTTAGQAAPLLCSSATPAATTTSYEWTFSDAPDHTPYSGIYYLYARLYDSDGIFLTESKSTTLLTIDSTRADGIGAFDKLDGDSYFYVQNSSVRQFNLIALYPDSVAAINYTGSFPEDKVQILSINEGPGWESVQNQGIFFDARWDNVNGTFTVSTAVIGSNKGLVSGPPSFVMGVVTVQASSSLLTSQQRFVSDNIEITSGQWSDYNNTVLTAPTLNSLAMKCGYLGDIADQTSDRGTAPHLIPNPDGKININDIIVFTLGWNGSNGTQDQIADLAPYDGTLPNYYSTPDGEFEIQDLMIFTLMFDWYQSQNYPSSGPGDGSKSGSGAADELNICQSSSHLKLITENSDNQLSLSINAENVTDLMSAELRIRYSSQSLMMLDYEKGEFLCGDNGNFFSGYEHEADLHVFLSRLNQSEPSVSGNGALLEICFAGDAETDMLLTVEYNLIDVNGESIETGEINVLPDLTGSELPIIFSVEPSYPNPFNPSFVTPFSTPGAGMVQIALFDLMGRRLFSQSQMVEAGHHQFMFTSSAFENRIASGAYLLEVTYDRQKFRQNLIRIK